jgi:hypothetical protein
VPFVSIYRPIRVGECNDTGMKKKKDVMEIKGIINGFLINRVQCLNCIKMKQLTIFQMIAGYPKFCH